MRMCWIFRFRALEFNQKEYSLTSASFSFTQTVPIGSYHFICLPASFYYLSVLKFERQLPTCSLHPIKLIGWSCRQLMPVIPTWERATVLISMSFINPISCSTCSQSHDGELLCIAVLFWFSSPLTNTNMYVKI